jgi:hypothetical protein
MFIATATNNPRLEKVIVQSQNLSALSNDALQIMDHLQGKKKLTEADLKAWQKILDKAAAPQASTTLAVYPGFQTLFAACEKVISEK